ncbi:MAG: hypothetical protein ACLQA5_07355 [Solirubrobacteraceae bacterium]
MLAVIANRDWLNFKNKRYFPISLSVLMAIWAGIVGFAYYLDFTSDHLVDPAISKLQAQVASANRERDAAILERDNARRANNTAGSSPIPSQPAAQPTFTATAAEARIDVWKSIGGIMNDFDRILRGGDAIIANWKTNQATLAKSIVDFRQNFNVTRGRLEQLISTYPEFSDLKIIDLRGFQTLSARIENVQSASIQLPGNAASSDYEIIMAPYMGQLKREILQTQQLVSTIKSLVNSSVVELSLSAGSK